MKIYSVVFALSRQIN